jgi:hypothetical protein
VLRPTGELLLSTPNAEVSAPAGAVANPWHVREYTLTSLTALLDASGLRVLERYVQGFPPLPRRGHSLAWRAGGLTRGLPAPIRIVAGSLLGDAEVRPQSESGRAPGFWVIRAGVAAR